jgi:hypothetical protein
MRRAAGGTKQECPLGGYFGERRFESSSPPRRFFKKGPRHESQLGLAAYGFLAAES